MPSYIQVMTTTDSKEEGERIAMALVREELAACVQMLGPCLSTYRWEGKIEQSEEWICLIKSEERLFQDIEGAIKDLHSYDTPEIIAVPLVSGSSEYLTWLSSVLRDGFSR